MKLCVVNAGNSNVQHAIWDGAAFSDFNTVPSASFSTGILPRDIPMAAASVVPSIETELMAAGAFMLNSRCECGLDLSSMDASTIGSDRLANAIALTATVSLPAVCVDCGTAITFEVVDQSRRLLGGAILPGRMLMRKALTQFTAKLPMTELSTDIPRFPGTDTDSAIKAGVDIGATGAVKQMLSLLKDSFQGTMPRALACGGDARYFIHSLRGLLEDAGASFTLLGIAKAWELNRK